MKKKVIQALSVMLAVVLTLTAAPLSGFIGVELPEWLDFSINAKASEKIDYSNLTANQYLAMIFSNNNYCGVLNEYGENNDFPPYSLMHNFYFDAEKASRARIIFHEINQATDYKTTKGLYEILTFDGSSEVESVMELEDYYTAILLSIINVQMSDENFIDYLNCKTNKTILSLSKNVSEYFETTAELDKADAWKFLKTTDLSDEDFQAMLDICAADMNSQELLNLVGKDIGIISDIFSVGSTINDAVKNIADFAQLANMNTEIKAVLEQIYANCPNTNLPMKNAARKVYQYVSEQMSYEIMALSEAGYAAYKYALSEIVGGLWKTCLTAVFGHCAAGVMIGQAVGKIITNYCFATDAVDEQLCAISAIVDFEDVMLSTVSSLENTYMSNSNIDNSNNYVESLHFLMSTYDLGCDYVEGFINTLYTEGAINNILYKDSEEFARWRKNIEEQKTINKIRKTFLYLEKYKEIYKIDAPSAYKFYFSEDDGVTDVVPITSMNITQIKSLSVGDRGASYDFFQIDYLPDNHTDVVLGEYVYSSDESIIKVDNSQYIGGYIEAVGEGTCTLTFTNYGMDYSKSIEVAVDNNNGLYTSDWAFNGDSYYDSINGYYVLTPDNTWSSGSIWLHKHNLKSDFKISLDYYSGNRASGADGLAVVFYNDDILTSGEGEAIMYGGLTGYAIELDTYYNNEPTTSNHISINKTQTNHLSWALLPESEDGKWHKLEISVDNNICKAYIDGVLKISYEITKTRNGYLGITAATGSSRNLHAVKNIHITDLSKESADVVESISIHNNPYKTEYEIKESLNTRGLQLAVNYSDGSTEILSSGYTVSGFSSTTTGTKTVTVSYGGKSTTFTVTVANPLTHTLSYSANGGSGAPTNQTGSKSYTISNTVPTKFGYTFLGWSKYEDARTATYGPGDSISVSENTTLYAVWEPATITLINNDYLSPVDFANQEVYYIFTPDISGKYVFESTGSLDTKVYVYNSSGTQLGYDDDSSDEGANFKLSLKLTAGTKYYVKVRAYSTKTGTTSFSVKPDVVNTYTISYDANGGSGAPSSQTGATNYTISSTVPTRFGYTFLGWSTSSTATSATYEPGDTIALSSNTTLYAVWKSATTISSLGSSYSTSIDFANQENYYTFTPAINCTCVIYSTGDEDTRVYLYNSSGTELANNNDGGEDNNFRLQYDLVAGTTYYFKVEYYNSSRTGTISFKFGKVYTITYNANGGSGAPTSQNVDYGCKVTLSTTAPTRAGYIFLGWSTSSNATNESYYGGNTYGVNSSVTLYAVWEANTYSIEYNANGANSVIMPANQTKAHDETLTLSTIGMGRTGYEFLGWATSSTATSATYQPGDSFTTNADTTLYAVWKANTYTVKYNANGGTGTMSNSSHTYDVSKALTSNAFTRSGYTFLGWSTSSTATSATYTDGQSVMNLTPTNGSTVTLYAVWKLETSELSVNTTNNAVISSGGEMQYYTFTPTTSGIYVIYSTGSEDTKVFLYNSTGTQIDSDDDDGDGNNFRLECELTAGTTYRFGIRYYSSSKTGTIPFVFGHVYTVSYNANGGSGAPSSQSKDFGKAITLSSTVPTKTGYTFLGWSTNSAATRATYQPGDSFTTEANTTLYAVWHTHTYMLVHELGASCTTDGSKTYGCTGCSHSYTETVPATGHTWTAATCTSAKTCSVCKTTSGEPLGHSYTSKVTKAATCTTSGTETFTCSKCSDSYTETILSTGHNWKDATSTEPKTCQSCGATERTLIGIDIHKLPQKTVFYIGDAFSCNGIELKLLYDDGSYSIQTTFNYTSLDMIAMFTTAGPYKVTVYSNGFSTTYDIEVKPIISKLLDENITLKVNDTAFINYETSPSDINEFSQVIWESSNSSVVSINSDGKITARKPGVAEITLTVVNNGCGATSNTCTVTVVCDHNYTSKVTKAATCTTSGTKTFTCSKCSDSYTETIAAMGHTWTAATCTAKKTCSTCGATSGSALGHSYTSTVTKAATCTTAGTEIHTCSRCSHSYVVTIPATGHTSGNIVVENSTAATCGQAGSYDEVIYCVLCDEELSRERKTVNALPHSYNNWVVTKEASCTESGTIVYTCTLCDDSYTEEIEALGHNYSSAYTIDIEAGCTTNGSKSQHCSRCNSKTNVTTIPAFGHTYGAWIIIIEPGCTSNGAQKHTCETCGNEQVEVVSATGHKYFTVVTAPTCTTQGYSTHTCECGDTYSDDYVNATGEHQYSARKGNDPTCTEDGFVEYCCDVCEGAKYTEIIPATGHNYIGGICKKCGEKESYVPDTPEYNYTFSIQTPSTTTIRHKDGIILHADIEGIAPDGCYVEWTSSNNNFKETVQEDGNELKIISDKNGYTTFTATLYDADGNVLTTDTIEMRSKAGFFDKIGSFFRGLFGGTKVYEY